ncbi:MAG TPA: hypothetical protein VFG99_00335, partial [Chloroflexia bacterium]|nr:hypothetical protein [Chloroflexia bacterium]
MLGSVYVHDRNNEGLLFMDQVHAASGGRLNFDIMGIHTFMLDRQPEDVLNVQPVQNLPYRIQVTRQWLDSHGGGNVPIWITEEGQSTCRNCGNLTTTPDRQAARLVRQHMLAIAAGASHFSYFQLRSKFEPGFGEPWASMELVDPNWDAKPAYSAYKTMTRVIGDGRYAGPGPLLRPEPNNWQQAFTRYEYLFKRGQQIVHVLWLREDVARETVQVPVTLPYVRAFKIDGQRWQPPVVDGKAEVELSPYPVYIVEEPNPPAGSSGLDEARDPHSPTGFRVANRFSGYWQRYGGLASFGYPISGERMEKSATDGKEYVVQWFERARFEYHPENAGTPYEVLLGLLGTQITVGRTFARSQPFQSSQTDLYFPETGHGLRGRFREHWASTGGLFLYGYPISEEIREVSPTDGKEYTVQYFERARFELHPEHAAPFDVLLGLLGRQLYKP